MKILSMTDTRLQDRIDAPLLLQFTPELDVGRVREKSLESPPAARLANRISKQSSRSCFATSDIRASKPRSRRHRRLPWL